MRSIVELLAERESEKQIVDFCQRYERLIPNPKNRFHSTVYHSSSFPVFGDLALLEKIKNKLPVVLNQESYFFDIFENCLVLRYENETVREINEVILSAS